MKTSDIVIAGSSYCLAHVPDLVRHGSKPRREIQKDAEAEARITASLRTFGQAKAYPPNRTFIGAMTPDELKATPRPWYEHGTAEDDTGKFGSIIDQDAFYTRLKDADIQEPELLDLKPIDDEMEFQIERGAALAMWSGDERIGCFRRDMRAEGRSDPSLGAPYLLENLCAKASGAHALEVLLEGTDLQATDVDFLISCGEEACGDRYQRGGGGMAKSIGQMVGCSNAAAMDVKNFCAAPASALMTAAALVRAGLHERVVVVGGGSLAKLGMKFLPLIEQGMPILDDCLGSMAFLVTRDDGVSPIMRMEPGTIGTVPIGSSASDEAIYRNLVLGPLKTLGLTMQDVDRYAPELHNPEIMELAGSGDVVRKNYRTLAALAVISRQIEKSEMNAFIERIGMPGFAPTQGHIPSGVPYIGHAAEAMTRGEISRVMIVAKASLFLNRMTELFDGVSIVLEKNSGSA